MNKVLVYFYIVLLNIHPENPQQRFIDQAVDILRKDGVIIYPTDTVYGLGCDINSAKAVERIYRIKQLNPKRANLSILCNSMSHVSEYAKQIDNQLYRTMKRVLPGPFTFILSSSGNLPNAFKNKKKTIGIRIPDNNICQALVETLGHPIVSTSLNKFEDDIQEYYTNPEFIHKRYHKIVDLVIDGGMGGLEPSTIIDASQGGIEIVRQGLGEVDF